MQILHKLIAYPSKEALIFDPDLTTEQERRDASFFDSKELDRLQKNYSSSWRTMLGYIAYLGIVLVGSLYLASLVLLDIEEEMKVVQDDIFKDFENNAHMELSEMDPKFIKKHNITELFHKGLENSREAIINVMKESAEKSVLAYLEPIGITPYKSEVSIFYNLMIGVLNGVNLTYYYSKPFAIFSIGSWAGIFPSIGMWLKARHAYQSTKKHSLPSTEKPSQASPPIFIPDKKYTALLDALDRQLTHAIYIPKKKTVKTLYWESANVTTSLDATPSPLATTDKTQAQKTSKPHELHELSEQKSDEPDRPVTIEFQPYKKPYSRQKQNSRSPHYRIEHYYKQIFTPPGKRNSACHSNKEQHLHFC